MTVEENKAVEKATEYNSNVNDIVNGEPRNKC